VNSTVDLNVSLPAAFALGALHFLEPGHGKGVMAAYLVSSRARARDAVLLGFTAAASHTFSILFLALVATTALQFVLPSQIEAWLGLLSGIVITWIGGRMVFQQLFPPVVSLGGIGAEGRNTYVCSHGHVHHIRDRSGRDPHHHHEHAAATEHHHHHGEELPMAAAHAAPEQADRGRLLSIGILAGLIPCPSSLVMLLTAISAGQVTLGIGLVLAFSLGGAIALSVIGMLLLQAESKVRYLERRRFGDLMASVSAVVIVVIGFLVTHESLLKLGFELF